VIALLGSSLLHVTTCICRQMHLGCAAEANHRKCGQVAQIGWGLARRPGWRPEIVLAEEGLLDRASIYGTVIHPESLRIAESGTYDLDRSRASARAI
jgi:hypothetical protein